MPFNTLSVGAAVTPTVIETWISHYINRKPLHQKPTAHISYHVGLNLVRSFLVYASHHTIEDLQAFTSQWVPTPRWVRTEDVPIPREKISESAEYIEKQLGPSGIDAVGGATWWQWRAMENPLKAEWVEMRSDFNQRKQLDEECTRCMLYVHGGAYYFGSVDEHRYQMQRHARKLGARVFAPRYRLAPQFPFPCGLQDCLAAYLHLLTIQPPDTILLGGDSAGGGMVIALLVLLRDQGIPMPAGAILLSPWVDLTHSFPSVAGGNAFDYIPEHGFLHRPSRSWPPPNSDDLQILDELAAKGRADRFAAVLKEARKGKDGEKAQDTAAQGFSVIEPSKNHQAVPIPGRAQNLSIQIDGKVIEIKDQIQIYATNSLLSHPLVSPVMQPSLGGLPPLLIQVGGGEMLRDEQIYLAHKAAAPAQYPPSKEQLEVQGASSRDVTRYPPTDVQLQVWEDLCHVAPTLSFTRPAKFMYKSVAQFGAWALARAQKRELEEPDEDNDSIISSASSEDSYDENDEHDHARGRALSTVEVDALDEKDTSTSLNGAYSSSVGGPSLGFVGQAGTPLPPFVNHMIRERVTRHGEIFPLAAANSLPGCTLSPSEIGVIKPGPVRKWLATQETFGKRFSREKRAMQEMRIKEMGQGAGYLAVAEGERPPPTALVGRRKETVRKLENMRARTMGRMGLKMWAGWGSKHDDDVVEKRRRAESKSGKDKENEGFAGVDAVENVGSVSGEKQRHDKSKSRTRSKSRSKSHSRPLGYRASISVANNENVLPQHVTGPATASTFLDPASAALASRQTTISAKHLVSKSPAEVPGNMQTSATLSNITSSSDRRPSMPQLGGTKNDANFRSPFKLAAPRVTADDAVSTVTLNSAVGISPSTPDGTYDANYVPDHPVSLNLTTSPLTPMAQLGYVPSQSSRRPSIGANGTRAPFKLAPHLRAQLDEDTDARSTMTLSDASGIIQFDGESASSARDMVVQDGEVLGAEESRRRPEPVRFVTAREEIV